MQPLFHKNTPLTQWTKLVFLAALLSLLAACSTPNMPPERAASIQRVGIVSLLPSELRYDKIGVTIFNNEHIERPVGEMLNAAARSTAQRILESSGRQVVQIAVDVPTLAKKMRSAGIIFDSPVEQISDEVIAMAKTHKLDAVMVIAEAYDSDNGIRGVRMFLRAGISEIWFSVASGEVMTTLVDPKAKRLSGQGRGVTVALERPNGQPWKYALKDNLDRETEERVQAQIVTNIEFAVAQHLRYMGF